MLAARQYWYATADKEWLEEIGFPLAKGVAEFYAKRVTPRAYRVTTRGNAQYDLNDVMGPDEYAFPVNNSAYTNAAAALALNFATEAAGVLGKHADPTWATVAEGLALAVSDDIPLHPELKGGYHPECTFTSPVLFVLFCIRSEETLTRIRLSLQNRRGLSKESCRPTSKAGRYHSTKLPAWRQHVSHIAVQRSYCL